MVKKSIIPIFLAVIVISIIFGFMSLYCKTRTEKNNPPYAICDSHDTYDKFDDIKNWTYDNGLWTFVYEKNGHTYIASSNRNCSVIDERK